jgi:hypothetical protein
MMNRVEDLRIDSDENGFELVLTVDELTESDGQVRLHVQAVAVSLLAEAVTKIGPWALEGMRVRREFARTPFDDGDDDELPWPGEGPIAYFKRTGNADELLEMADRWRKQARENGEGA